MKLKKVCTSLGVLLGIALLATACAPSEHKNDNNAKPKDEKVTKISIGTMAAPDSAPLYVAADKGYFKDEGLDVKLQLFKDPNKRDAAASADQIDAAVVDFTSFTSYMRNNKKDWKLITQLTGRFGIAVPKNSKIKDIKELKDKKIANMSRQVTDYYMYKTLKAHGVNPNSVDEINVPQIPQRLEMIKNNQADAAVLPQTFLTMAHVQGCKILSESKPNFQVTALAAKGVLIKNKNVRTKFIKAYNRAVKDLNQHPQVLKNVLIKDLFLPKPVAELAPKEFPHYNLAKTANAKTMADVLAFAKEKGFFTKKVKPSQYIIPVE